MRLFANLCIYIFFIATGTIHLYAESNNAELSLGVGLLRGYTTYQIGGSFHTPLGSGEFRFPLSELQFPLDVYMISAKGSIELAEKLDIGIGVMKNISDDAGKMEDSDWGLWFYESDGWPNPDSLDIYSESDAELNVLIIDMDILYKLHKGSYDTFELFLLTGIGYNYQKYDFNVSNLNKWYPSLNMYYGYDIGHEIISGKVLTYEIKYNIPYVKIAIEFMYKNNSHFQTSIGYSQIVDVEDYDNHILRSKRSRGECEGDAILFSLCGRYCFINNLFFTLQFDYITVEAEGRQKQRQDGIYIGSIDQKITSKQKFLSFESGYRF